MNRLIQRAARLLTCGCATALALIGTAHADDSEIYISQSTVAPNIMLILDTSGSMGGQVTTQDPYDPKRNYVSEASGDCAAISGRVFLKTGDRQGTPPRCDSNDYITEANLRCSSATSPLSTTGSYPGDRFTQWRTTWGGWNMRSWTTYEPGVRTTVDCRNDSAPYPNRRVTNTSDTPPYSDDIDDSFWQNNAGGGTSATLYSANYVAYYRQFRNVVTSTRLQVMQQAAKNLLNSATNVNVGLMRYSLNNPDNGGGMVLVPVAPIEQNRAAMIDYIDAFVASGNTPLSETLYEAYQYFRGGSVFFGNTSRGCYNRNGTTVCEQIRSANSSRLGGSGDTYASPANLSCQNNYIIYLTDGEPTLDNETDDEIKAPSDFASVVPRGCDGDSNGDRAPDANGSCLPALSEYMFEKDLRSSVTGTQNVTTYYIGFGSDFGGTSNSAFNYLVDAADRGGGEAYQAGDLSELAKVFTDIFNSISKGSSTLTAPTVAVNAFNRTQTLNDLYISVFQPSGQIHWPGNIKKFRIDGGDNTTLLARGGVKAVGDNGMFLDSISDYWSKTDTDGSKVELGGAALQIPAPATRDVYTYLGNNPGTATGVALANNAQAAVNIDNALLTDAVLGTATDNPLRDKLINWARGADVDDEDEDEVTDEARFDMGDPMHSQPAVVIYGGSPTAKKQDDAVVFTATNDGYLHAFATETGEELWSFVPKEMLSGLKALYRNEYSAGKNYAIDGDLRLLKYDTNADGVVDPNDSDRVLLFFSTGRNPKVSRYYALDVTSKEAPRFLWSIGADELPGLGQAWSRPTITRVNVSGEKQNTQRLVLIFGGGYDPIEEGSAFFQENSVGNRLFMVDALYGTLLWSAGKQNTDLNLARMTHSIPASVNVMDLDGDSFAERMYAADMAGQVWRFDIFNGKTAGELVTGGVFASLGAKEGQVSAANTRRFYNEPDTAILKINGRPFVNIAIGSGYRGHPLATDNQDRFYAIRDYQPYALLTQTQYGALDMITDNELDDITTNFAPQLGTSSRGWKLQLNDPTYRGEKVLSSSTTFGKALFFTSYTPSASNTSNQCSIAVGSNRAYAISAFDGSPLPRRDSPTTPGGGTPPTAGDRYEDLGQTGIAPEVVVLFPDTDTGTGTGTDKDKVKCLAGVEVLNVCKDFGSRINTYWRQTNAN